MRRVLMGVAAATAAYQTWGIYKIMRPSSNFLGGLERLEAEASAQHPVSDSKSSALPPGDLPIPDGIFRVRLTLPFEELLNYVRSNRSDVLYINFRDFPFDEENLYRYLVSKAAFHLDKADITNEEGEESLKSLLGHLILKMVEKMTEHRANHLRSSFGPQAWLQFWYQRFYKPEDLENFYTARFPVVILEGCEVWQELLEEDPGDSAEKDAMKEKKLEVLLNFLKWLYVFRHHMHVVMLTTKPIDQVLNGFSKWFDEQVAQPDKPQRPPELIVRY